MSYAVYDFSETLKGVGIERDSVKRVAAAWGESGTCAEWDGGFLIELNDGRWAYVSGWCDTTGWGCQDGTDVKWFDAEPKLHDLNTKAEPAEWENDPADCNRYVRGEIDEFA